MKSRETVFLPPREWSKNEKNEEPEALPLEPPKIWAQWIGLISEPCNEHGASEPPVGTMCVFRSGNSKRKRTRRRR